MAVGWFVGVDPLAQEFAAWSGYNYVLGNPVSLVDPDGRSPDVCPTYPTALGGAVIGGLIGGALSLMNQMDQGGDIDFGQVLIDSGQGALTGAAVGFAGPNALSVLGLEAATAEGLGTLMVVSGASSGVTELVSQ